MTESALPKPVVARRCARLDEIAIARADLWFG